MVNWNCSAIVSITLGKSILEFSGAHFLVTYSQQTYHRGDDVDDEC